MPKMLKAKRIANEHEWACKQFLINLLAGGYRVINPDGVDITEAMIKAAAEEVRLGNFDRS